MKNLHDKSDDQLKKLFSHEMLEQPSADFTSGVMDKLGLAPSVSVINSAPVISKAGWVVILTVMAAILYFAVSWSPQNTVSSPALSMAKSVSAFASLATSGMVMMIAICSFAAFLLFTAEAFYRRSRLQAL